MLAVDKPALLREDALKKPKQTRHEGRKTNDRIGLVLAFFLCELGKVQQMLGRQWKSSGAGVPRKRIDQEYQDYFDSHIIQSCRIMIQSTFSIRFH